MELAEKADIARIGGDRSTATSLLEKAAKLEERAALAITDDLEPTRSVLHRSAAELAFEIGHLHDAERLAARGLGGRPPEPIASELRSLVHRIGFEVSMKKALVSIEPNALHMKLSGGLVGAGIVPAREFRQRIEQVEKMIIRTAERKAGKPFRVQGAIDQSTQLGAQVFIARPVAASFAVDIVVGKGGFLSEHFDPGVDIVAEIVECMKEYKQPQHGRLANLISDTSYLKSFIASADVIAPDGRVVEQVALGARLRGVTESITLAPPALPELDLVMVEAMQDTQSEQSVELVGLLKVSDLGPVNGKWSTIKILDGDQLVIFKVEHAVIVDVVSSYFGQRVEVRGRRRGASVYMTSIRPVA